MMATAQTPIYVHDHFAQDLNSLIEPARFVGDLTTPVLQLAGLQPGMRVLDAGSGTGDVSFLAANLVGPGGHVIGVDKTPETTRLAAQRATEAGLINVQFLTRDLSELTLDEPVDALIGRLVLMCFADPAVLLRRLSAFVKPGGVVVFQEFDLDGVKSAPACSLFDATIQCIRQTLARLGMDFRAGLKLARIFQEAGLPTPQMILGAHVEHGSDSLICEQVAKTARTLLPLMERTNVATASDVDVDTLAVRLRTQAVALNATLISPSFIGAWTQKSF